MEDLFRTITFYLASAVEAAAALVIALATLEAVVLCAPGSNGG